MRKEIGNPCEANLGLIENEAQLLAKALFKGISIFTTLRLSQHYFRYL